MALTTTTLASPQALTDKTAVVTSATGFAAGNLVLIDGEVQQVTKEYVAGLTIPVLRGLDGTQQLAHVATANVTTGLASDFPSPGPGGPSQSYPTVRARVVRSYSAAGAITLPTAGQDMVAIINGTGALAMTLANPTKEMDGSLLIITANGKAAHTVTYTAGLDNGGSGFDVGTFSASIAGGCILVAMNGFWNCIGNGILGATAATGAPLWA